MKTALKRISLCAGFSCFVASCSTPNPLQGHWSCVSATINGKPLPEATVSLLRLTLTKDRYKTEKGSEILFDSTYAINPTTTPKQMTMIGTEGDLKGKEAPGIYALEQGTLRICYTMPGHARPTSFESNPGSGAYLTVWKRQEPQAR